MMAGNAFLDVILAKGFYEDLLERCERSYSEVNGIMKRLAFPGRLKGKGTRCSFLFGPPAKRDLNSYADMIVDNRCTYSTALRSSLAPRRLPSQHAAPRNLSGSHRGGDSEGASGNQIGSARPPERGIKNKEESAMFF